MPREKYMVNDNQWVPYEPFDVIEVTDSIHAQVGATFPMSWDGFDPIIDFGNLPDGVTENEVKQAVRDNHPHR